ncbi:MAG: hypothetical protein IVW54_02875 [Candidatus Binataceae bacterium]|nr:hypothetical protein [Candidatus Binataceae bacterium]
MLALAELKKFAAEGARILGSDSEIAQFELYCSSTEQLVARLNYTSDIPSRGVEECKLMAADGFAIRIVTRRNSHEVGHSFIAGDLSREALREALARARRAAVIDPHFPGLPNDPRKPAARAGGTGDLIRTGNTEVANAAWAIVDGAIGAFTKGVPIESERQGLVLGGDVTLTRDRFAIAGSNLSGIRTDQTAYFSSSVTAIIKSPESRATAIALGASRADLRNKTTRLGHDAVTRAIAMRHGVRLAPGRYRIVFGPQPVAEMLCYMVIPSLTTGAFQASNSAYHGRFGSGVMDSRLTLFDQPAAAGRAIARNITCEGLPARRTMLIREGRAIGLLSNFYDAHRLASDEHRGGKLGPDAPAKPEFSAGNGYRLGEGGGRRFDSHPGTAATNVVMRTLGGVDEREMIRLVGDGIYVGRVWYTYPINGQRAGDFTCTITGDSYLIWDGKLAEPLAPNCLRINANLGEIFSAPIAVGRRTMPAIVWGAPEMFYVPSIAADSIGLSAVAPESAG